MTTGNPGVQYTGFYYPEILRLLTQVVRYYQPDFREDNPHDPIVAILRAIAFVQHRYSAAQDRAAEGVYWPTFATRADLIALGEQAGIIIRRESPATVDMVGTLSGALPALGATLLRTGATVSSRRSADVDAVLYEYLDAALVSDTTALQLKKTYDGSTGLYAAWAGGVIYDTPPNVGDALYVGHPQLMFDSVRLAMSVPFSSLTMSTEYYDEGAVGIPDGVVDNGDSTLTFDIRTHCSTLDAWRTGLQVVVRKRSSGVEETLALLAGSRHTVTTTSLLGQMVASTSAGDYDIITTWTPFSEADLASTLGSILTSAVTLRYPLPQSSARKWALATVDGDEAYWVRLRVTVTDPAAVSPNASAVEADGGSWYLLWEATQGRTVSERIGTSTGEAWQRFELPTAGYINGSISEVRVGVDTAWSELASLYYADADTKAYTVEETADEIIYVRFGDGANGVVPPLGDDVYATYRVGALNNGNVGADSVTSARTDVLRMASVTNPRSGSGWTNKDGYNDADLQRMKLVGPASVRAQERAVTAPDYEYHAMSTFLTSTGAAPVKRCIAVEAGAGPETVLLIALGILGADLSAGQLEELELYFNGDQVDQQRFDGIGGLNTIAVATNKTDLLINVNATLTFLRGYSAGKAATATAAITALMYPDATEASLKIAMGQEKLVTAADHAMFLWRRGGTIGSERVSAVLHAVAGLGLSTISGLTINGGASVVLTGNELPMPGAISINAVELA
jgi:hypothetical protein